MKSLLAFFLLTIVCSVSALSAQTGPIRPIPEDKLKLDRNLGDVLAGLKSLADSFFKSFQDALDATGNIGGFMTNLKIAVAEKLQAGREMTVSAMGNLVMNTMEFAGNNNLLTKDDVARILVTFGAPAKQEAQPLSSEDIKQLGVTGDEDVAAEFREGLEALLKNVDDAANTKKDQRLNILAGLESLTVELMAGNGKVQFKGVVALKRFFNLQGLVNALKNPLQTFGAISRFVKGLEGKIVKFVQGGVFFLNRLQQTLEDKFRAAGELSKGLLQSLVTNTLELVSQNGVIDQDGSDRLLATFADILVAKPLSVEDIDKALFVGGNQIAAAKFKQTLKNLLELKSGNITSNFALLGGLEAALLNNMAANALVVPAGPAKILNKLGLTPVLNLIDSSLNLLNDMQDGVAHGVVRVSTLSNNFKSAIQEKVKAGGDLTLDVLTKSLPPVLTEATRVKMINANDAARIAATFRVTIGTATSPAGALTVEEAGSLSIGGDASAAAAFKETLSGLVTILNDGQFGSLVSTLAGLNVAVVDLLAINKIVSTSAAVGLKAFFVV